MVVLLAMEEFFEPFLLGMVKLPRIDSRSVVGVRIVVLSDSENLSGLEARVVMVG